MTKEDLSTVIRDARIEAMVSITELRDKGIHPILPSKIESGNAGYTIDSLLQYLNAIDERLTIKIVRK